MRLKTITLISGILLLIVALTACGTNATATPANELPETTEESPIVSTLPALTETSAPVSTDTPAAQATQPATSSISFANDVLPIFESRCVSCHGGEQTKKGLDLKTYDSVMAGSTKGPVILAGNADESVLAQIILEGKMPKRGPKLTPAEVQTIIDWINAGAPNN